MAFPAPVGTRPQRPREPLYTRDSNALRASVLDAALQLGVGSSRAVENLLFDSILEDDEVSIVLRACCSCFCALAFFTVNTSPSYHIYDARDRSALRSFFLLYFAEHYTMCACPKGSLPTPQL